MNDNQITDTDSLNRILGFNFISDIYMTISIEVMRSQKERWLSWPWKPWKKMKEMRIPDPDFRVIPPIKTVVAHPETIRILKIELAKLK